MAVTVGQWRWYSNATPDASMVALAAENTAPVLTQAQIEGTLIRLRVQLIGDATGGTITLVAQHGVDGTNWKAWASTATAGTNEWARWANGAASAGGAVGTLLLTGSTHAGIYRESSGSVTVGANQIVEFDLTVRHVWIAPGITLIHRLLNSSTALGFAGGVPAITVQAPPLGTRKHAIDLAGTNASAGQIREIDYSSWPRMFHSQSGHHWFFAPRPALNGTSVMTYWRWDGTGGETGTWTRATVALNGTITTTADGDVRHAPCHAVRGGIDVFAILSRPSSGNLRYIRGRESSGTITWGSNADLGATSGDRAHCAIDDGGKHWIASSAGSSVWAVETQTADDGTVGWAPDFGTITARRYSITTTAAAANPVTIVPIAADQALVFWYNSPNLQAAKVTAGSGFGSAVTVNSTAQSHNYDWGVARSGGYVYVVYRDGTSSSDAPWVLRVYDIAANSWSTGPGGVPKATQNSNNDGIVVTTDGDDVYAFGTAIGSWGNQDRPVQYVKYFGPGASGSWDTSITSGSAGGLSGAVSGTGLMAAGNRGNGDDISGMRAAAGGKIVLAYLHGDCDVNGHPFSYEYFTLEVAAGADLGVTDAAGATDVTSMLRETVGGEDGGVLDNVAQTRILVITDDVGSTDSAAVVGISPTTIEQTDIAGLGDSVVTVRALAVTELTGLTDVGSPGASVAAWNGSALVARTVDAWNGSALVGQAVTLGV
jgi:hypothetical protein